METITDRRLRLLGPGLRQFYDFPFQPVCGKGVWLKDSEGKSYLDAYNNVPHVGHCHPHVLEALTRQASTLNTNTRYLHDSILEYAERLVRTMPAGLDTCLFVCTGTEANDLAWRLACAYTGNDGAIATRHAYHGNSRFVSALDCSTRTPQRPNHWLATVPAPQAIAGEDAGRAPTGEHYASYFNAAIDELSEHGHGLSAFYFDTLFASDGLAIPPKNYMTAALSRVRSAGGLSVADEVQPGLGRTGTSMWGFQELGVVPDIVTTGKPMGNGHPIGVVITRREIVEMFFSKDRYFNTFGGNPVSAAVGLAVLEVIEREDLAANAHRVGTYLKEELLAVAAGQDRVGRVRGKGFFLGIEIVDPASGKADADKARAIINRLCRRGILVGLTGPANNYLKIRPPLVFDRANADQLLSTLQEVLRMS